MNATLNGCIARKKIKKITVVAQRNGEMPIRNVLATFSCIGTTNCRKDRMQKCSPLKADSARSAWQIIQEAKAEDSTSIIAIPQTTSEAYYATIAIMASGVLRIVKNFYVKLLTI